MKFVEAIKAMGTGQLLIDPKGGHLEVIDGVICDGKHPLFKVAYQDTIGWRVIDKPRPRVRFDAAIAAAAKGAVIKSYCGDEYIVKDGVPLLANSLDCADLDARDLAGDWEIIEPEGYK